MTCCQGLGSLNCIIERHTGTVKVHVGSIPGIFLAKFQDLIVIHMQDLPKKRHVGMGCIPFKAKYNKKDWIMQNK